MHKRYDLHGKCDPASVERSILEVIDNPKYPRELVYIDSLPEQYFLVLDFAIEREFAKANNVRDGSSRFIVDTRMCKVLAQIGNHSRKSEEEAVGRSFRK